MILPDFVSPRTDIDAFNCPRCHAYAHQHWADLFYSPMMSDNNIPINMSVGICDRCKDITVWKDELMIDPLGGSAPNPDPDMPDYIKKDYEEARSVVSLSPRAACGLLRLCIENICNEKIKGGTLNDKIGKLVKQGLNVQIKHALDVVRVIGNEAIHHSTMDLRDDIVTATTMFEIVNYISNWAYTQNKVIDSIYDKLPENQTKAIHQRDSKST